MKKLSPIWQKCIVWFTAYVNIIAFVIAGGFIYNKTENEDVRGSAKLALLTFGSFTVLELVRSLVYNLLNLFGASYDTLSVLSDIALVFAILRILAFVALFVLDLCGVIAPVKEMLHSAGTSEKTAEAQVTEE